MAGRAPLACLAILAALVAAAFLAPVASAGYVCVESVNPCAPAMELYKYGPSYVNQGQSAEYTFQLYNSGAYPIENVVVSDDKCSPVTGPENDTGDDGVLGTGETWNFSCEYQPAGVPGDRVDNEATANGTALGEVPVTATASHSTWITGLEVEKTVDLTTADPFDELNYTITVTNNGPDFFDYQGYIYDDGCEDLSTDSENTDGPWLYLAPGESVTYTCHHNFDGGDSYTNEACVSAYVYRNDLELASIQGKQQDILVCDTATTEPAHHTVSGTVFEDMNADGAFQNGEPPIAGVVVYADLNGNGVRDEGEPNSTSDGQGHYSVEVPLGTTTIRQETPGGLTCSLPSTCSHTVDLPKNSPPAPPVLSRRVAARADDPTGKDFGDWRPASVTGTVISDDNGNGARDSGEPGLAGIAVFADLDGNGILDQGEPSSTSAADGTYVLGGLKPGGYVVRHVLVQDGRACTAPNPCAHSVSLVSGQWAADRNFLDGKAAQAVLGARIIPGVARMTGKTGCVYSKGFYARIRGKKIREVVFLLDGRAVKSIVRPFDNRTYRYRVNVARLKLGAHTIAAKVSFMSGTKTKSKTIRLTFNRCAKQLRAPAFTG
jgi:hypothetical protein